MTEVRYSITDGRKCDRRYLLCEDHATGNRDVCAAVSTIVFTLAVYLKNADKKTTWSDILLDEGYAEFAIDTTNERVVGAWEAAVIGLKQLQNSFGEYIHVAQIK